MSVLGHQRFVQVGARVFFKRDNDASNNQFARRDLGIIDQITVNVSKETAQVYDTEGGRKVLADEAVTKQDESYQVRTKNLSMRNLALALLADDPVNFTQSQTEKTVQIRAFPGDLLFTHDSDSAKTRLFKIDAFGGVYTGAVANKTLTTIVAATKTITLSGDQTAVTGLAPGKAIIVNKLGLTKIANSRTYTIVTRILNAGNTDLVVDASPAGDESAITGQITHENGGVVYKQDTDWELRKNGLDYGAIRIISGGAISTEQDVQCIFTLSAISGKRQITPQGLVGVFKGKCEIWIGDNNNDYVTVREAIVSISPAGLDLQLDEFSTVTLDIKVLSDITVSSSAGRMVNVKGTIPAVA